MKAGLDIVECALFEKLTPAELDIVECVLFEKLTPEGMYYAARGRD